jgi:hypothetical protein
MKRFIDPAAVIFGFLAGLTMAAGANSEPVALLINQKAYGSLAPEIETYKRDVEKHFPVRLKVVQGDWKSPDEVRAEIKTLYQRANIAGAILVGAIPMHRFFMHGFPNPNPLYYEDFDLVFVDRNKDRIADGYKGKPNPKLWVANLRCEVDGQQEGVEGLKAFFAKTQAYYQGKQKIEPRALVISGSDWPQGGNEFSTHFGNRLFGRKNIDAFNGKAVTLANFRAALAAHTYALCYIQVHSGWTGQGFEDGELKAKEMARVTTGALITVNHGCSVANWARNEAEKSEPNTAMSWVFNPGVGQAVVAGVRTGMVYGQEQMYKALIAGDYLGEAYLKTKRAAEEEMSKGDHTPGDIFAGVLLIGNPFLYLKPVPTVP